MKYFPSSVDMLFINVFEKEIQHLDRIEDQNRDIIKKYLTERLAELKSGKSEGG